MKKIILIFLLLTCFDCHSGENNQKKEDDSKSGMLEFDLNKAGIPPFFWWNPLDFIFKLPPLEFIHQPVVSPPSSTEEFKIPKKDKKGS